MSIYSKSGRVQYLCGKCRSPDVLGPIMIYGQQSIVCGPCAQWMPWPSRVKVSVKKVAPADAVIAAAVSRLRELGVTGEIRVDVGREFLKLI